MTSQYNLRSPAVKRLMREAEELREATEEYYAQPLDENLFEWHFTVKGPSDSDFSGGFYHGRIILPTEYPMKPPSIILLTPNGRFEINKKICLSISGHHPESWQPSWSIRTALLAIIGFMPTEGLGAIGSLDFSADERKDLASKSRTWSCPSCGIAARLLKEVSSRVKSDEETAANTEQKELAKQICFKEITLSVPKASSSTNPDSSTSEAQRDPVTDRGDAAEEVFRSEPANEPEVRQRLVSTDQVNSPSNATEAQSVVGNGTLASSTGPLITTYLIVILTVAIAFLIVRRLFLVD